MCVVFTLTPMELHPILAGKVLGICVRQFLQYVVLVVGNEAVTSIPAVVQSAMLGEHGKHRGGG